MQEIELPEELRTAIDELAIPSKGLAGAVASLSKKYRSGGGTRLETENDLAAYAIYRMPATYAAVYSALGQVKAVMPDWSPESLLDAGAGPGTSMWAVSSLWPRLRRVTLLERDSLMIDLGKRLASRSPSSAVREAEWVKADLTGDWAGALSSQATHDITVIAYVHGELGQDGPGIIEKLWDRTRGVLLVVEPGTPASFARIREVRKLLIGKGGKVLAPCPHSEECPLSGKDWCHFSQRVARSRIHRQVKSGELGYEDEKFSLDCERRVCHLEREAGGDDRRHQRLLPEGARRRLGRPRGRPHPRLFHGAPG